MALPVPVWPGGGDRVPRPCPSSLLGKPPPYGGPGSPLCPPGGAGAAEGFRWELLHGETPAPIPALGYAGAAPCPSRGPLPSLSRGLPVPGLSPLPEGPTPAVPALSLGGGSQGPGAAAPPPPPRRARP